MKQNRMIACPPWTLGLLLLIGVLLTACSPAAPSRHAAIPGLAGTLAAQTLTAQQGGFRKVAASPTPLPPAALQENQAVAPAADEPAQTLEEVQATPLDVKVSNAVENCTNAAMFVDDVSIPDDTKIKVAQRFTKTWRFENVGTCTWTSEYSVVFVNGDKMNGLPVMPLPRIIKPGETVDISIPMEAPAQSGFYKGNWIFLDQLGNSFGTGYRGRDIFWVAIQVIGGKNAGDLCIGGG